MKRIKKRVINTAALGLALLVTPTLTYRSAINTYAQAALTADEEAKIQAFLATEPQNNDTTNCVWLAQVLFTSLMVKAAPNHAHGIGFTPWPAWNGAS